MRKNKKKIKQFFEAATSLNYLALEKNEFQPNQFENYVLINI